MSKPLLVIVVTAMCSGCVTTDQTTEAPAITPAASVTTSDWANMTLINFPLAKAIIWQEGKIFVGAKEADSDRPSTTTLSVRFVDSRGRITDVEEVVNAVLPGLIHWFELDAGGVEFPALVTANCGCPFVYIWSEEVQVGDASPEFLRLRNTTIQVFSSPEYLVADSSGVRFEETLRVPEEVLGYTFLWSGNLLGDAYLYTPSGRELAHWEMEGRHVISGHVSNGTRPFEAGDWTLAIVGDGNFKVFWKETDLEVETWSQTMA